MFIRKLLACEEFTAGDNTRLREILHPNKEDLALRYSLAHAVLKPGATSYAHSLSSSEIYYILEGQGMMYINNESQVVNVGDTVYIAPNSKQYIKCISDVELKFICIVDPAWREDDEIVYKS